MAKAEQICHRNKSNSRASKYLKRVATRHREFAPTRLRDSIQGWSD